MEEYIALTTRDEYLIALFLSLKKYDIPLDICTRIADMEYPGRKTATTEPYVHSATTAVHSARTAAMMARWVGRGSRKIS
jgi:hypothetical protein